MKLHDERHLEVTRSDSFGFLKFSPLNYWWQLVIGTLSAYDLLISNSKTFLWSTLRFQSPKCSFFLVNVFLINWNKKSKWYCLQILPVFKVMTLVFLIKQNKKPKWYYLQILPVFEVMTFVIHFSVFFFLTNVFRNNKSKKTNRHDIWSLSDSNRIRTHNHLVRKGTLNH